MKRLIAFSFLALSPLVYAQTGQHEHRMSPQVHRCMKVMDDPKYMEEMLEYMLQKREEKMSTFGIHRLDWLMITKRFPWNVKYETIYGWLASFIVIYTIMKLKS